MTSPVTDLLAALRSGTLSAPELLNVLFEWLSEGDPGLRRSVIDSLDDLVRTLKLSGPKSTRRDVGRPAPSERIEELVVRQLEQTSGTTSLRQLSEQVAPDVLIRNVYDGSLIALEFKAFSDV